MLLAFRRALVAHIGQVRSIDGSLYPIHPAKNGSAWHQECGKAPPETPLEGCFWAASTMAFIAVHQMAALAYAGVCMTALLWARKANVAVKESCALQVRASVSRRARIHQSSVGPLLLDAMLDAILAPI